MSAFTLLKSGTERPNRDTRAVRTVYGSGERPCPARLWIDLDVQA
jgi:hypothetical protein